MKHLFIINPAAGNRNRVEQYQANIHAACHARDLDYRIAVSQCPGDATRIAREAAQTGEEVRIYACGGDGTLNEVAAGAAGFPNAAITVYSGGSGNDFIKLFDDPTAFFDIHRLLDADEATFDIIRCNDHLALNICSIGLDARINQDVSKYKRLPMLGGFKAYLASTAVHVFKGLSEHYVIDIDDQRIDDELTFITICNGRYYGGGFCPVPEADPSDGKLEVLVVKGIQRYQIPAIIGKYKDGRYKELTRWARHFRTDRLTVTCDGPTPINLDGETKIETKVDFSIADEKLRFFYPKGLHWKK